MTGISPHSIDTGVASDLDPVTEARRLQEEWERLSGAHIMVGARCSCGAPHVALRLADFEQDIVEYLEGEGERHQRRDVLALLRESAREGETWSATRLLAAIAQPPTAIDPATATFVLERLATTLKSFEGLHRGRR